MRGLESFEGSERGAGSRDDGDRQRAAAAGQIAARFKRDKPKMSDGAAISKQE